MQLVMAGTLEETAASAAAAMMTAMFGMMGIMFIVWAIFALFILVLSLASIAAVIWALYMILTAKNENEWKILWALIVLFTGIIGAALYYFIAHKERIPPDEQKTSEPKAAKK